MIVTDGRVAGFVAERCGIQTFYPPFTCMGIERDGRIVAGVVFNCYQFGRDIAVTVAGDPGAFTPGFVRDVGAYVFGKLGCSRISITTEQASVIRLAVRMGASVEGIKRDLFGEGRPGTMLGLRKQDWNYT